MRVILTADVRGLGRKGEVREVNDGHARNFLIPRHLAEPATGETLRKLESARAHRAEAEEEYGKRLREAARRIKEYTLEMTLKTDVRGSVFGSITKEMIQKALRDKGLLGAERIDIELAHPIREFGEHKIRVDLKKGIEAELKLRVLPRP